MTNVTSPTPHLGWHSRGYLPHWDHPGMIQSLNFRLADSLPKEVLQKWRIELNLEKRDDGSTGILPMDDLKPSPKSAGNDASTLNRIQREIEFRRCAEDYLDAGHGACWLRRPEIASLVEGALQYFDGQRYRLLAWCIMPNHVHALIETMKGFPLGGVLHSWKSFTSTGANKLLGRRGKLWQREYLDRYVRNAEHYEAVIAYIEENSVKAGLCRLKTEWAWSSARFRAGSAGFQPAS